MILFIIEVYQMKFNFKKRFPISKFSLFAYFMIFHNNIRTNKLQKFVRILNFWFKTKDSYCN